MTEDTPGYIADVQTSIKPKSAVSHSVAAPPSAREVAKLFYQTSEESKYFCVICHSSYKNMTPLENHLRNKHGRTLVISCKKCGTVFEDGKALNRHMKRKTDCSIIPKV